MERSLFFREVIASLLNEAGQRWEDVAHQSLAEDHWQIAANLHYASEMVRALDPDDLGVSRFAELASLLGREARRYEVEPTAMLSGAATTTAEEYFAEHRVARVSVGDVLGLVDEMYNATMDGYAAMDLASFSPALRNFVETYASSRLDPAAAGREVLPTT